MQIEEVAIKLKNKMKLKKNNKEVMPLVVNLQKKEVFYKCRR